MPTIPGSHRDILERSQIVTLATLGPQGEPQVTAMWFLWEDGTLRISLNTERQKAKNLMRDPRLSAFFVDPENPYRTIEIRGTAQIEPDEAYELADRVGLRYGADLRQMDQAGGSRIAVTIVPDKINAYGA